MMLMKNISLFSFRVKHVKRKTFMYILNQNEICTKKKNENGFFFLVMGFPLLTEIEIENTYHFSRYKLKKIRMKRRSSNTLVNIVYKGTNWMGF